MKRLFLSAMILLGASLFSFAQNDIDAFRFSQHDYEGTARFMGAGGAFSAVGAEFSAVNVNPAAIGVFKKSEITFTPMVVSIYNDNSNYNGTNSNTSNVKYSLSNAGGVFRVGLGKDNGWKAIQFGIGYNRTMDFNNIYRIEGVSNNSSMMDPLVASANTTLVRNPSSLNDNAYLAWQTRMIDTLPGCVFYSPFSYESLNQKLVVESSGAIDEVNFSFGGNYNDQLFIGATIGVPVLKYDEKTRFSETPFLPLEGIDSYSIYENYKVRSTGVNLKLGLIYQPVDFVRIGAAFHTPSYYGKVKNTYHKEMISYYANGDNSGIYERNYAFDYTMTTPLRAIGSVAFLIAKRAFVSAEYEFTGYGMAKMSSNDYNFDDENAAIQSKYGACHTVRVGGEIYVTSNFLLRAGYNYMSSPYKQHVNNATGMHTATAGLGVRTKHFFADVAYVFKTRSEQVWLYDSDFVDPASLKNNTHRIVATLGCKF